MSATLIGDAPEDDPAQYVTIRGRLDEELFRRCARVADRECDAHRIRVCEGRDGVPSQRLDGYTGDAPSVVDLSDEDDPAAAAGRWMRARAARPVDHERGPLHSWTLLRLSGEEHWWHMRSHHIVADLYSFRLLVERTAEVYTALHAGRECPPRRFGSWTEALRAELAYTTSTDRPRDERYWTRSAGRPAGPPDGHQAPGARRGTVRRSSPVGDGLRDALRDRCRDLGVRPAHVLVAAFAAYLRDLHGGDDAVFSLPVTARRDELARRTPGMLSNVVPFHLALPPRLTVEDLVRRTRDRLAEVVEHSRYRGEDLARDLGPGRSGAWFGPVLNVVEFTRPVRFADAVADVPRSLSVGPARDLTVTTYGWSHGDRAWLDVDLDGRAGAPAEIDLHRERFLEVLEHLVTGAGDRPARLPAPFRIDRTLIRRWEATAAMPAPEPVTALIRRWADRRPDTVAVACGDQRLTYAELDRRAERLAQTLRRDHGITTEAGVGVLLPRSPELAVAFLAVLKAGGAYVPLPLGHPPERLRHMAADAGVRILLTTGDRDPAWTTAPVLRIDRLPGPARPEPAAPETVDPDQLAYVAYTSGSTGTPKGVGITRRALSHYVAGWTATLDALDGHRTQPGPVLSMAGTGFDVSVGDLARGLCLGHGVVLLPETTDPVTGLPAGLSVERLHDTIRDHRVEIAEIVPGVLLRELAAHTRRAGPLDSLRVLVSGTDTWQHDSLVRTAAAISPNAVPGNVYGVTEATIDSLFMPLTNDRDADGDGLVPIGRPLPGTRVVVLDDRLDPTPVGVPGELFVAGHGLARGYVNRPDLTAERFLPDPAHPGQRLYRTGDRARWNADGDVEFLGRTDQQVKIRGHRIEPGEIVAVLTGHPAIRDAVVTTRNDGPAGPRLIAHLVPDGPTPPDVADVRDHLAAHLPAYMIPAAFVTLADGLPLTPNGKVDLQALPAPDAVARDHTPPRTATEHTLARIWEHVLGRTRVGTGDNFFELGGDSILSLQIVARARTAGLRITIADIFAHQTVGTLATTATPTAPLSADEQGPVSGPVPLTPIEHWFLAQDIADRDHWNWSGMVELAPGTDHGRLARAFDLLVDHHDALRLRLVHGDGHWHQYDAETEPRPVLAVEDATGLHGTALAEHVTRRMTRLQATLDLASGPLLRAVLFDRGDHPAWLGITVHHLVMDGVSWRILLRDLGTVYDGGTLEPKTTSFQSWARRLCAHADTPATWSELGYWRHQLERRPPLPADGDGPNSEDSTRVVRVALDARTTTTALQTRAHHAYRTQINDLLLAALLRTIGRWAGTTTVGVDFESHGREPLDDTDVTRTVGWFTSIYPLALTSPDLDDPARLITSVKEHLRHVPRRGLGYGLLRHVTPVPGNDRDRDRLRDLRALPAPQILFNYMGATGAERAGGPITGWLPAELAGPRTGPETGRARSHLLQIEVAQAEDGRLVVEWFHSPLVHRTATVRHLAEQHLAALRELIEHCLAPGAGSYTPSDFPLSSLDGQGLAAVLRRIGSG